MVRDFAPLARRYLLVAPIPYFRDHQGGIWLDPLWARDLQAHLDYLSDMQVLAPRLAGGTPPPDWIALRVPEGHRLSFVQFGQPTGGWLRVLAGLPGDVVRAWGAVGRAELVHSGVAGWPIPPGLLINPMAVLRRRPLIVVIESAFWRLQDPNRASARARLRAALTERFARWSLRRARLGVFTSTAYRDSLPLGPGGVALVLPASWIAADHILSSTDAGMLWRDKGDPVRFLLASRLIPEKGIGLFLEALRLAEARGWPLQVDVLGEGPMLPALCDFAAAARSVRLTLRAPVPYGAEFLRELDRCHGVIVPTTGDEQPRILYDALARALPVVATDTPGNREVLSGQAAGCLLAANTPEGLALALAELSGNPKRLRAMGLSGLEVARGHTHDIMHQRRAQALHDLFGQEMRSPAG